MSDSHLPVGNLLYQHELAVRWGDMDALGHVNNIMYFQYFEQTRLLWFETFGFGALATSNTGFVIVNSFAEFLRPVVYPAMLTIRMAGHSPGTSSFESTYTLMSNDTLFTRGSARIVWIDTHKGKSLPLPDVIREQLTEAPARVADE